MKKMMMLLSLIFMVGVVQAASVDWRVNNKSFANKTLYVFNGDDSATFISYLTNPAEFDLGAFMAGVDDTQLITSKRGTKSGTFENASSSIFFVVADAPLATGVNFKYTDNLSTEGLTYSQPAPSPGYVETAFENFKSGTVVPEPTTFALLALGMAAFGLRRKIRA